MRSQADLSLPSALRIALLPIMLAVTSCSSQSAPTTASAGATNTDSATQRAFIGCYAAGANMSNLGCGAVSTLGSAFADGRFNSEVQLQLAFWQGVPANVAIFNECGPEHANAYAGPDRSIRFGLFMHNDLIGKFPDGLPVAGVLAHEWGHQVQFAHQWMNGNQSTAKPTELEADAFGGYYIGMTKQYAWTYLASYFQQVFDSGDYNFNHRGHHGTPQERLAASRLGFDIAIFASSNRRLFSYQELHAEFVATLPRALTGDATKLSAQTVLREEQLQLIAEIAAGATLGTDASVSGSPEGRRALFPRQ